MIQHSRACTGAQVMVERIQQDDKFGEQLVQEMMQLKEENEVLKAEVEAVKRLEQEAQQALRQAKGISSYLKNKQGEIQAAETKKKLALYQANGMSNFLKNKNKTLEERLKKAERHEVEAQLALRQARGVSAYLKSKNASLEKKLVASQQEKKAELVLYQARRLSIGLRNSLEDDKGNQSDYSDNEQPSITSTDDEAEKSNTAEKGGTVATAYESQTTGLTAPHTFYILALVAIGAGMAYENL